MSNNLAPVRKPTLKMGGSPDPGKKGGKLERINHESFVIGRQGEEEIGARFPSPGVKKAKLEPISNIKH